MESEKDLERALVREVKKIGGHALKFSSGIETGYPDRLVMMPGGRAYWVEVKSEGKKPRKIQLIRHDELRKLGFEVFVISKTTQLENFIEYIRHDTRGQSIN